MIVTLRFSGYGFYTDLGDGGHPLSGEELELVEKKIREYLTEVLACTSEWVENLFEGMDTKSGVVGKDGDIVFKVEVVQE